MIEHQSPVQEGFTIIPDPGTLYGVGVGPGAPDLITLRAIRILANVDVILAAASPKNDHSLALSIAKPHLPDTVQIVRLDFPMTCEQALLEVAWRRNAQRAADVLMAGKSAAFLTLGDPLIYSTFGYLLRTLKELHEDLPVQIIPGITSYQEAAAKTHTILCESHENLLIIPGVNDAERLRDALRLADSAVILKTYRNSCAIYDALAQEGTKRNVQFASRLGLDGETTAAGLENLPEKPHYLSLILAPPMRGK